MLKLCICWVKQTKQKSCVRFSLKRTTSGSCFAVYSPSRGARSIFHHVVHQAKGQNQLQPCLKWLHLVIFNAVCVQKRDQPLDIGACSAALLRRAVNEGSTVPPCVQSACKKYKTQWRCPPSLSGGAQQEQSVRQRVLRGRQGVRREREGRAQLPVHRGENLQTAAEEIVGCFVFFCF